MKRVMFGARKAIAPTWRTIKMMSLTRIVRASAITLIALPSVLHALPSDAELDHRAANGAASTVLAQRAAPGASPSPSSDLTGSTYAFLVALSCGQASGGDLSADAATSSCPSGLEDMVIEEAERACGGQLIVYYVVCRYLGNGWWDFELRGRCRRPV